MKIEFLIDYPEFVETVARWNFEEWSYLYENSSLDGFLRGTRSNLGKTQVPCTLVAIEGSSAIGSVSLLKEENEDRKDLSPWLSSMYVLPSHRKRGIGKEMEARLLHLADAFGKRMVYLEALDEHLDFYSKMGWNTLEARTYRGVDVTIMQKSTSAEQDDCGQLRSLVPPSLRATS